MYPGELTLSSNQPVVDTELDCWALCRQSAKGKLIQNMSSFKFCFPFLDFKNGVSGQEDCQGFVFAWDGSLGMTGSCTQKKAMKHSNWADDMRTGFLRWKSGQNVYIDKGSLCPRGYLNIHNYILPTRLNDDASFASKATQSTLTIM